VAHKALALFLEVCNPTRLIVVDGVCADHEREQDDCAANRREDDLPHRSCRGPSTNVCASDTTIAPPCNSITVPRGKRALPSARPLGPKWVNPSRWYRTPVSAVRDVLDLQMGVVPPPRAASRGATPAPKKACAWPSLPEGFVSCSTAMARDVQVQVSATSRSESAAFPVYSSGTRHAVLAMLDARARGLDVSPDAVTTAFMHDPVLEHFRPNRVVAALRKTGQPQECDDRRVMVAALQSAGRTVSEASLWLAALDDELTDGPDRESPLDELDAADG